MELDQSNDQVSTEVSTTESTETAASTETTPVTETNTETPAVPAFTPNYKFYAEKKEYEVPEKFRSLITDEASQKEVVEVLQKAFGLDHAKAVREQIKNDFRAYKEQVDPIVRPMGQASQSYQRALKSFNEGNKRSALFHMDAAMQSLGINDKVLQQYTLLKLQMEDLDPVQKAEYYQQRDLERAHYEQQSQLQTLQTQYQQMLIQQRTGELDQVLSKPEMSGVVQSFDQRNGQGAFKAEVIRQGQLHYQMTGQDIPAHELVDQITRRYGYQAQQVQPQVQQTPVVPAKELPVIPVAKGGVGNPAARKPKTLKDLQAYAATLED